MADLTKRVVIALIAAGCAGKGSSSTSLPEGTDGGGGATTDAPSDTGAPASGDVPARESGVPVAGPGGILDVRILDPAGKPTAARVNVIGSDHAFYEPVAADNPLFDFSLKRIGFRLDRGPVRYYGSFFYTDGAFQIRLPAGAARLEVQKGYSHYPSIVEAEVVAGQKIAVDVPLHPVVDMPKEGWYGTDTHLHFNRLDKTMKDPTGVNIPKLLSAEGVQFGHSLSYNDYGAVAKLLGPQATYGKASLVSWNDSLLVSGHEHISSPLGHVTEVMISGLPKDTNPQSNPSLHRGPSLAAVYEETKALSGAMGFAHGGYKNGGGEILADIVLKKSDWVEILQFGWYVGIGLDGYYRALGAGFRYPLAGASDYPACRVLSSAMTYVMDDPSPTFDSVTGGLLRGESFATSGPLLFFTVDGKGPGSQIEAAAGSRKVTVKVRAVSAYLPFTDLEVVVNGAANPTFKFHTAEPVLAMDPPEGSITVDRSSWIAARCLGPQGARAHTNPVWIYLGGATPFDGAAAGALKQQVDQLALGGTTDDVTTTVTNARDEMQRLVGAGSHPAGPVPNFPRTATVAPGTRKTTVMPVVLPRPNALASATVGGTVVDENDAPLAGATVSARGTGPAKTTDGNGKWTLAGVPADDALFVRVSKPGYATTNSSYLNPRCGESCVKIVCMTSKHAGDLMKSREPGLTDQEIGTRAWVAFNAVDAKGALKAGVSADTFPYNGGWSAADSADRGYGVSPARVTFGFVGANGKFGGSSTVAKPPGGVQALGSDPLGFNADEDPDLDRTQERNLIVSFPALGKDLVLPVFAGQMSYGVVGEGL